MNAELLQYRNEVVAIQGSRFGYDVAEDAFQQVVERICRTSAPVAVMPRAWLLHATKMQIFTIFRGETRRRNREKEYSECNVGACGPEDFSAVASAMKLLPKKDRVILKLMFYRGLSQIEIANMFGVNQSSISRSIQKSVGAIRRKIHISDSL